MIFNGKKWFVPVIAVIGLLLIIAIMAGAFRDKIKPGESQPVGASQPVGELLTIQPSVIEAIEPVPATIGARQATTISSRIIARITAVLVRAGDPVVEGQLLLELERSDLESRLSQAMQRVNSIAARLTEAKLNLERAISLQQQGLVARAVLDEARAGHDALTADLASAERSVEEARVAISYAEIRSPIDGRVIDRFAEPGDTASPGERLLSLYNPLSLRTEAAVRESLALSLTVGQALQVEIPALDRVLAAEIEELVPAADPGSRSFLVKARVEFKDDLLPGMYARLMIPAGSEELILIPASRVTAYGQLDMVWVVRDGMTERRFVRLGRVFADGRVEVLAGLEAGEVLSEPPN